MARDWRVQVQVRWPDPLTDKQIDDLVAALPGCGMAIHDPRRRQLTLRCDLRARSERQAEDAAYQAARAAVTAAGVPAYRLPFQVRVLPAICSYNA